ncbi:hypothetical protein [Alicyclobacillus fastidiosus]|uniref:Uncharacterized protein n=1 Tax=Alicyclobacillus fastidiosus TaxID=392011 RepID=A0ABV5ALH6_9BACL|nr:hypothetical protein [Alicyclobacillus fastidiosus]WEH11085.1 hypothetical protein PYS47_07670 [Alicyclobacillus fastidiosus]
MTGEQQTLAIEAEQFTEREKWIISRLREFCTIDREIRKTEAHVRGDALPYEPSVTRPHGAMTTPLFDGFTTVGTSAGDQRRCE